MERRRMGNADLMVTALGLGTVSVGKPERVVSDIDATEIIRKPFEVGANVIDTAPDYG